MPSILLLKWALRTLKIAASIYLGGILSYLE
jgi:hypothetical protein